MQENIRALIIEDSPDDYELIVRELHRGGYKPIARRVDTTEETEKALNQSDWDVVICDHAMAHFSSTAALAFLQKNHIDVPFIIVSGTISEEIIRTAITSGARDCILKSNLGRIVPVVRREIEAAKIRKEHRLSQVTLHDKEEEYKLLFDNNPHPMWVYEVDTLHFLTVNDAAVHHYGFSREDFLSMTIKDIRPDEDIHKLLNAISEPPAQLDHAGIWKHRKKNGSIIDVEITSHALLFAGRQCELVLANDVTERKKAEEEILTQKLWLQQLFEKFPSGTVRLDENDNILEVNNSFEEIFQYSIGEIKGKNINDVVVPEELRREGQELSTEIFHGKSFRKETVRKRKDGTLINTIIVGVPVIVNENQLGNYAIYIDITEKKKLEAQLLRTQRLESIGTLAGGVAHDLNNVLSPIMLAVQILRKKLTDDDGQRLLNTLESSSKRGADIVRQVLTFARGVETERALLQPKHVIREMQTIIRETFPKSIQLKTDIKNDLSPLNANATQLHQVLLNLCVNSRDAMPEGGTITMTAENVFLDDNYAHMHPESKPGWYVEISVADTGTGISRSILDKIFDPFFTTKEIGKGTGLGLSSVLGIVKSHGGFLNVYSEERKGTCFTICLPVAHPATRQAIGIESFELPMGNGELIIVVDDEASICEITKATLSSFGYNVIIAHDGTEAISVFARHQQAVKAVITDMMMPFMDGPATIRALRKFDAHVKIIATSGLAENEDLLKATRAGADSFLQKPYTP